MQDIPELERRITAALERIGRGAELLAAPPPQAAPAPDTGEIDRLTAALEEERMANAQLQDRLRTVREKDGAERTKLAATVEAQAAELAELNTTIDQLNDELALLRRARPAGDGAAQIAALQAELAAHRSARAAEAEELAAIVAALTPLIEEARANA